ncbi:hypothetical protein IFM89_006912 [Coptis chinensis]|uniref:Uncharacterized protein n=1 Tax=Coptis chinensis TaxID=261450 RepID=A0A835H947_9MAGN|nr:hypothetical protein IFM89_006912 [Coptis chinensis]
MAIIADFMLVWLPAPTISLRAPIAVSAGRIAKFFYGCPDNAFQVALAGTSYSFLQRIGAILRNGTKLFAVGTGASLVGTGITNVLISTRKALDKSFAGEAEDVPILSTSVAYGVYMAVSSNLRQHILGIIDVGGLCSLDWNPEDPRIEHNATRKENSYGSCGLCSIAGMNLVLTEKYRLIDLKFLVTGKDHAITLGKELQHLKTYS